MNNFKTFYDFESFDNFFTINNKFKVIYGHYHPDDETIFIYKSTHNNVIQHDKFNICSNNDLLNNNNNKKYEYNNISDAQFVASNLKHNV